MVTVDGNVVRLSEDRFKDRFPGKLQRNDWSNNREHDDSSWD